MFSHGNFLLLTLCVSIQFLGQGQTNKNNRMPYLIKNSEIQIEITDGFNSMYNFDFEQAESQFRWLRRNFPTHPLAYLLLGMSQWWKIVPQIENEKYDKLFLNYMDSTIYFAKRMLKQNDQNTEAYYFLAASYGFKGRLLAERRKWPSAILNGKSCINNMNTCLDLKDLGVEMEFAKGLYNYYAEWIPKNYNALKVVMWFFRKGNKKLGIQSLETAFTDAFYTRIEALYYIIRIYTFEQKQLDKALYLAEYVHKQFPNNPYFHRFYARLLYSKGKYTELESVCLEILKRIEKGQIGYEENSGRYASFFLASKYKGTVPEKAKEYYRKTVYFSEKIKKWKSGYYHYALFYLAKLSKTPKETLYYCNKVLKHISRKSAIYKSTKKLRKQAKRQSKNSI